MTTITRQEARRRVAELQGWTDVRLFGNPPKLMGNDPSKESKGWNVPDCFDLDNAVSLLWQLPDGWGYTIWGYGVLDAAHNSDSSKPNADYSFDSPEAFAVACVSAYITAKTGERVEIKGS